MRNRVIKIVIKIIYLAIVLVGGVLALLGGVSLLLFLTDPDVRGDSFYVVLAIIFLSLGVAISLGGVKLLASTDKKAQDRNLEKPHLSQRVKADSDNLSRTATAFSRDTEIFSPEVHTLYCPNCGIESDKSARFCRDCGRPLSDAEQKTSDPLPEHSAKSQEPPTTLAEYMSAKIQQMKTAGDDAALSPPSSKSDGTEKAGGESEGDTEKNQQKADSQVKISPEHKKKSEPTNKDKLLGCAVIGVIILVALVLMGSCSDAEEVGAVVPLHGLIDHHDRYNGKRVKVRGHVGSIGWEVWGGHQPGLSDFVLLGPLGGPHPNYAARVIAATSLSLETYVRVKRS